MIEPLSDEEWKTIWRIYDTWSKNPQEDHRRVFVRLVDACDALRFEVDALRWEMASLRDQLAWRKARGAAVPAVDGGDDE